MQNVESNLSNTMVNVESNLSNTMVNVETNLNNTMVNVETNLNNKLQEQAIVLDSILSKIDTKTSSFDFIVVGSGPSGAECALELANFGYKVLIIERGSDLSDNLDMRNLYRQ